MRDPIRSRHRGDEGFALILAILALMLLTSLGIALSVTTTTEMQIAANYKWSQQALYNAEAGLEAGRAMLANGAWYGVVPQRRPITWDPKSATPVFSPPLPKSATPVFSPPLPIDSGATRNFENGGCDVRGAGAGYGAVLRLNNTTWENISTYNGARLQGAFTLWVRRPTQIAQNGDWSDYSNDDETAILTSEGVAPFTGAAAGEAFVQENRAVRVIEMLVTRRPKVCDPGNVDQSGEGETNTRSAACGRTSDSAEYAATRQVD